MRTMIAHMRKCAFDNLFYPAILTACAIPDICAALEDAKGKTDGNKYAKWWDTYAAKYYDGNLTGEEAYYLRCSILHQGRVTHKGVRRYKAIGFIEAHSQFLQGVDYQFEMYHIQVPLHCERISNAVIDWLKVVEKTIPYQNNYKKFFKRALSKDYAAICNIPLIIAV